MRNQRNYPSAELSLANTTFAIVQWRRTTVKTSIIALLSLATFLMVGCDRSESTDQTIDDEWFPLKPKWEWRYQTVKSNSEGVSRGEYLIENLGETDVNGDTYFVRRNDYGTKLYFSRDDSGVYRIGKQTLVAKSIAYDPSPRYVLPKPRSTGKSWFVDSRPYVMERLFPIRESFTRQNVFQMSYTIESTGATITVPAGTFENTLHIKATGTATVLADLAKARYGASDAEMTTEEWYAKGIGLVKLVRTEYFPNDLFTDGSYTMELTEIKK